MAASSPVPTCPPTPNPKIHCFFCRLRRVQPHRQRLRGATSPGSHREDGGRRGKEGDKFARILMHPFNGRRSYWALSYFSVYWEIAKSFDYWRRDQMFDKLRATRYNLKLRHCDHLFYLKKVILHNRKHSKKNSSTYIPNPQSIGLYTFYVYI
jgi:hypothetical protein